MDCFSCFILPQSKTSFLTTLSSPYYHHHHRRRRHQPFSLQQLSVRSHFRASSTAPLEPSSPSGKHLNTLLLDDPHGFLSAATTELDTLALHRDQALARHQIARASHEATLHRRIAELKTRECNDAVEDILYALILHKFYDIHVHLVPKLSKCICNRRLEIVPSKEWELESVHPVEVLEMVREYISSMIGCQVNSCVKENWGTTAIQRSCLCELYLASVLFGYFLKSASLRHRLDWGLDLGIGDQRAGAFTQLPMSLASQYIGFGHIATTQRSMAPKSQESCRLERKPENLRFYLMGLDEETVQMCAKPKSKEVAIVIERHVNALFGEEGKSSSEVITTSIGSMKRLLLEGVAFGCFLWDAEKWMNGVYTLEDNHG